MLFLLHLSIYLFSTNTYTQLATLTDNDHLFRFLWIFLGSTKLFSLCCVYTILCILWREMTKLLPFMIPSIHFSLSQNPQHSPPYSMCMRCIPKGNAESFFLDKPHRAQHRSLIIHAPVIISLCDTIEWNKSISHVFFPFNNHVIALFSQQNGTVINKISLFFFSRVSFSSERKGFSVAADLIQCLTQTHQEPVTSLMLLHTITHS
jgi:hypothetical protein